MNQKIKQQFSFQDPLDPTTVYWITYEGYTNLTPSQGEWLVKEAHRKGIGHIIDEHEKIIDYDSVLPCGFPIFLGDHPEAGVEADGVHSYGEILKMLAEGKWFLPVVLG